MRARDRMSKRTAPVAQMNDKFRTRIMKWIFGSYFHFHFRFFWPFLFLFVRCILYFPSSFFSHSNETTVLKKERYTLSIFLASRPRKKKIQQKINLPTKITTNMQPKRRKKNMKKKYLFPWTMSSHHFSFKLYKYMCKCACWFFLSSSSNQIDQMLDGTKLSSHY